MILKSIGHAMARRALKGHEANAKSAVREYEREKGRAEFRINEQLDKLNTKLKIQNENRDKDIANYLESLNKFLGFTLEIGPVVKSFYDHAYTSFEAWQRFRVLELELNFGREYLNSLYEEKRLLQSAVTALRKVTETEDKKNWRTLIVSSPLMLSSEHIDTEARKVSGWIRVQNDADRVQRERLESAIKEVKSNIGKWIGTNKKTLEALDLSRKVLGDARQAARNAYRDITEFWNNVKKSVKDFYVGSCQDLFHSECKAEFSNGVQQDSDVEGEDDNDKKKSICRLDQWGDFYELKESRRLHIEGLKPLQAALKQIFSGLKELRKEYVVEHDCFNHYKKEAGPRPERSASSSEWDRFKINNNKRKIFSEKLKPYYSEVNSLKLKIDPLTRRIKPLVENTDKLTANIGQIQEMFGLLDKIKPLRYLDNVSEMVRLMGPDEDRIYKDSIGIFPDKFHRSKKMDNKNKLAAAGGLNE